MENLLFIAGQFPLAFGLGYIYKEKLYRQIFEDMENSRVMDIEHIPSVDGIPRNKPVCMRAVIQGPHGPGVLPGTTDSVVSRVIPCYENSDNDDYHFEIEVGDDMVNYNKSGNSDPENSSF